MITYKTRLFTQFTHSRRRRILGLILISICFVSAGVTEVRAESSSPLVDWISSSLSMSHEVSSANCETGRCLFLTPKPLDSTALTKLKKATSRIDSSVAGATPLCVFRNDGRKVTRVSRVRLEEDDFEVVQRLVPGLADATVAMAINLKTSGISDSKQFGVFDVEGLTKSPEGKELVKELLAMARKGQVSLRAKLNQKPPTEADRTVIAGIDTDRGKLGLKMILNKYLAPKSNKKMSVVFTTPKGKKFELSVDGLARRQEIFENLTTPGGLLRTLNLQLRAGSTEASDFIVEFESTQSSVRAAKVEVAAVPLDSKGNQLGGPAVGDWRPTVTVTKTLNSQCEFEISFSDTGKPFELATFSTYYFGDDDAITSVLRFDPNSQFIATQFDKTTLCDDEGNLP